MARTHIWDQLYSGLRLTESTFNRIKMAGTELFRFCCDKMAGTESFPIPVVLNGRDGIIPYSCCVKMAGTELFPIPVVLKGQGRNHSIFRLC